MKNPRGRPDGRNSFVVKRSLERQTFLLWMLRQKYNKAHNFTKGLVFNLELEIIRNEIDLHTIQRANKDILNGRLTLGQAISET